MTLSLSTLRIVIYFESVRGKNFLNFLERLLLIELGTAPHHFEKDSPSNPSQVLFFSHGWYGNKTSSSRHLIRQPHFTASPSAPLHTELSLEHLYFLRCERNPPFQANPHDENRILNSEIPENRTETTVTAAPDQNRNP